MSRSSIALESDGEIVGAIVQVGEFDSYPFYLSESSNVIQADATSYFESVGGVMLDKDV